jgi:hypothetical protein
LLRFHILLLNQNPDGQDSVIFSTQLISLFLLRQTFFDALEEPLNRQIRALLGIELT